MPIKSYAALANYRRTVTESYARLRTNPNPENACLQFRQERDELFKTNPLSPIPAEDRQAYAGVPYAPYDVDWRLVGTLNYDVDTVVYELDLPEGAFRYQSFATVQFTSPLGESGALTLYWILGYGGGVFLPFGDKTNNDTTYGGGRYLYDTIKGADLGIDDQTVILDFNLAYHPSCRYSHEWTCPLAPIENRLPFAVPVGELLE